MSCVMCHMSHITYYVSHAMCQVSHVTCNLLPVTNANSQSHRPPLSTEGWFTVFWPIVGWLQKVEKCKKNIEDKKTKQKIEGLPILAIHSLTTGL